MLTNVVFGWKRIIAKNWSCIITAQHKKFIIIKANSTEIAHQCFIQQNIHTIVKKKQMNTKPKVVNEQLSIICFHWRKNHCHFHNVLFSDHRELLPNPQCSHQFLEPPALGFLQSLPTLVPDLTRLTIFNVSSIGAWLYLFLLSSVPATSYQSIDC